MKILFIASEMVPYAKTGGLADVAGALPKALAALGHEVVVIMPKYKMEGNFEFERVYDNFPVQMLHSIEYAGVYKAKGTDKNLTVFFISNAKYFDREGLYQVRGIDFPDNCERFSFFCKAVMEYFKKSLFFPEVLHANDWQTALAIAYAKNIYNWKKTALVYSVHNLGYLGIFPKEQILQTGFDWNMFTPDALEFYDNLALAKAGFVFADVICTVSETYAKEIQTKEFGHGLDGLLRSRKDNLFGILNGIDYDVWDPEHDKQIVKNYNSSEINLKYANKKALQKANGLPQKQSIPLIGMITRLADQKGFDILSEALDNIMNLKCQLVVLGTGDQKYHSLLQEAKKKHPNNIGINLGFDSALAQLIYAGSDMFLMPSRYEPCGLGQLISFKYGAIPIVRKTGGLADTVHDYNPTTGKGDGFVFEEYSSDKLLDAVKRAIEMYENKKEWASIVKKVMCYDYSWKQSAAKYIDLYRKTLQKL
ncbi:MAG: glgA [Candidatus Saganbacteria bacterium]|uniref:Glycogen synthase n=1 Tax=Candidatus Saganbacteria bacterium TaxID=2575572 RepID=A0A833NRA3_UNCSA|nr:MAG: glgA [Candidatus Saganbacteria bacterium]